MGTDMGMAPIGAESQMVRLVRGTLMIKPRGYIAKIGLLVSVACFLACDVAAGEWLVKSGLNVGEVYTDNVELDDNDKESKFISVVRPTFNLIGKGNRANVSFLSAFEFNNSGSGADSFSPKISGSADAELLEDVLFIDANLSSNQSTIDPFASAGNSQLNQSDNVTTTYDYSISPYVVKHFGQTADLRLRYTYDDQINKGDELSDSVQQSVLATLQSGRDFSRLTWKLVSDYQDTDYDNDESNSGQDGNSEKWSNSLTLGYKLNRKYELKGTYGQEWNNYQTFDDDDTDDHFWDVGVVWTPNRRTTLDAGYGKHFYSTTPRFKFTHETRKTTFSAGYTRSLSDTRSERINPNVFSFSESLREDLSEQSQLTDSQIDELEQAYSELLFLNNHPTFTNQGIFVSELFESSFSVKGKRTTTTIYFRESKQIREDVDEDGVFTSSGIRLNRKLSSKYTLNSRLTWDERKDQAGFTSDRTQWSLSLRRKLGARTAVSIAYSRGERDSDRVNDDYKENRVSLNFSIDL